MIVYGHGAERCHLKTELRLAIVTPWSRKSELLDPTLYWSMPMCNQGSFSSRFERSIQLSLREGQTRLALVFDQTGQTLNTVRF